MSEANKAIFLSYASQDAEAAKRICDALRAAGVEVWFDQSELVGGDQWDQKIRGQIGSCALFIPIISANTQARLEGYFRLEWKIAAQRTHTMADEKAFLLPILIDDTRDADAKVPPEFRAVQWTKLPAGAASPAFCARVQKLLGGEAEVRGQTSDISGQKSKNPEPRTGNRRLSRWWWIAPIFGMTMALALVLRESRKETAPPPAVAPAAAAQTEAQKLVQQAQAIYAKSDELDRETMFLADDLVKRALALDPAEPSAWALAARLSYIMVWQGYDSSEARKADLQRQSARARALAPEPDSVPVQLAVVNAQVAAAFANFQSASNRQDLMSVERDLRALAQRAPQDYQVQRALGQTYRFLQRPEEALKSMQRALELSDGDPGIAADLINVLLRRKRYAEAEALVAPALARRAIGRILVLDVMFKTVWRGDLAAAQSAVSAWPGWLLREDRGAFMAWQAWLWGRQPEQALDVAQRLSRDYLRDNWFTGPRAVLTARAHELAGHEEAAQADWRTVLRIVDRELAGSPDDVAALFWKAWAQSRLGDTAGAQATSTLLQQRNLTTSTFFRTTSPALLWSTMGRTDLAVEQLRASFGAVDDAYAVTRKMLELDPAYATLRADPRFPELRDAALAPKSETLDPKPTRPPEADEKSVAVLAFANLSDDKANEYFSDGISEELLNVLAKVPGLKVSARTSAFYFKGKEVPVPEIAKQLGVAYVVEGSVRKQGDKVRITAQLIKAVDGFHVWSDTFTRDLKDIFAVQDEIAGLIAKNLELKMGFAPAGTRQAVSPEAYQEFLVGRAAAAKASMADLQEAVGHFERAVALEPKYTAAWVQLASAHTRLGRWGGAPTLASWASARMAIDRAIALEPDSPDVLSALGWILRTGEWEWRGAERAFRRALALQPNNPEILAGTAVLLFNIGQIDEAFRLARQAVQLDPLNPGTQIDLSIMFFESRNWAESERAARRALQLAPDGTSYHSVLAWPLINQGRYAEAEAEIALDTDLVQQSGTMGLLAIARGDLPKVREMLARLEGLARTQPDRADLQTCTAWLHAGLGDKDRAFAALEKARASRDPSMAWLRENTELTPLFSDPRWNELLRKVGLTDDQLK